MLHRPLRKIPRKTRRSNLVFIQEICRPAGKFLNFLPHFLPQPDHDLHP